MATEIDAEMGAIRMMGEIRMAFQQVSKRACTNASKHTQTCMPACMQAHKHALAQVTSLDGRTGTARPARPTATAKAHAAPAKILITRSGHVSHADHLSTDHPTNVSQGTRSRSRPQINDVRGARMRSDKRRKGMAAQRTTHMSCTHNDDRVDGSLEAASGHTTASTTSQQPRTGGSFEGVACSDEPL